jgi:hypothetical protein
MAEADGKLLAGRGDKRALTPALDVRKRKRSPRLIAVGHTSKERPTASSRGLERVKAIGRKVGCVKRTNFQCTNFGIKTTFHKGYKHE